MRLKSPVRFDDQPPVKSRLALAGFIAADEHRRKVRSATSLIAALAHFHAVEERKTSTRN